MGTTKPQRLALVTVPNTYLKKLRLSHDILRYLWKYHDIDWYFFQFSQTLRYFAERLWECHQWEWECFTWPSKLPHSTLNSLTLNTQSYHTLKAARYSKLPDRKTVLKIIINSVLFINSQSNTAPLSSFVLTEDPFSTVDTHRLYWSPTDWITLRVTAIRNGSSVRTNLDNGAVFDWEFINRTLLREKKQRFRRKKTRQNFTSQIFVCTCFCCADTCCVSVVGGMCSVCICVVCVRGVYMLQGMCVYV